MDWPEEIKKLSGWSFGDSPEMADRLGALVVAGKKTATTGLLRLYEQDREPIPKAGVRSFIKNGKGEPLCVIELISVEVKPFQDVDADFAAKEGEGDLSLAYWQEAHRRFFTVHCPRFNRNMLVVCETFRVLHRF